MAQRQRFRLSWNFPKSGGAVLTFNRKAWRIFKQAARREGLDADEMIAVEVAKLVGPISNYRVRS